MDYKIRVTADAQEDLEKFISYLVIEKQNEQAAKNVLNDFDETIVHLQRVAGSLEQCKNPSLNHPLACPTPPVL